MDAKALFDRTLDQATSVIKCIEKRHFNNATPCTDWDCQALVNHMLYELSWVPDLLAGKTVAEVGGKYDGDLLGNDHERHWQQAVAKASPAVKMVNPNQPTHLSSRDMLAKDYIHEIATDMLIHAWDAAQSVNFSLILDRDAAQAIYDRLLPHKKSLAASGVYAAAIDVPEDARLQTKLLGLLGRREPSID